MSSDDSILNHPFSQTIYYLLLSTIPFYHWRQGFPGIPFDWILAIVLLMIISIHLVSTKRLPNAFFNHLNIWFILFFLINVLTSLFSEYRDWCLIKLIDLVLAYGFIVINLFFLNEDVILKRLPMVLGLSIGLNSLIAGLGYFFGMKYLNTYDGVFLTLGATSGSNSLALMCNFVIPFLIYGMLNATSAGSFFLNMFLVFINICGIISSESRSGFLLFIISIMMVLFFNRQRFQPRFFGIVISIMALGVLFVGVAIPDSYFKRQKSLVSGEQDVSIRRRAAYIRVGLKSFMENPFFGTGTGSFPKIWVKSRETLYFKIEERPTHNVYLQIMVDTGLIGLFIYLGMLSQVFKDIFKSIKNFDFAGNNPFKAVGITYMIAFIGISIIGLLKNIIDEKLFILILSLSQVIYFISKPERESLHELD